MRAHAWLEWRVSTNVFCIRTWVHRFFKTLLKFCSWKNMQRSSMFSQKITCIHICIVYYYRVFIPFQFSFHSVQLSCTTFLWICLFSVEHPTEITKFSQNSLNNSKLSDHKDATKNSSRIPNWRKKKKNFRRIIRNNPSISLSTPFLVGDQRWGTEEEKTP